MASFCPQPVKLTLHDDEAAHLRTLLTQTAHPGSFQSRLIQRLDAALEETKRDRYPRKPFLLGHGH